MKILFNIGPIRISFIGLMLVIGIACGIYFATFQGKKEEIHEDNISNLVFILIISGLIGARMFYVLFYNAIYFYNNPSDIFIFYESGLSTYGGIIGEIIGVYIYSKKSKISFFRLADISVITGTLALGIAKVGFSIFGKPMVNIMPWGVNIYGKVMHPVQLYEAILYYALFIFLWRKIEKQKYAGEVFSIYLILFPIIRGIVEFFKISPMPIISFSVNNFLNLIFIVTGIIINVYIGSKHKMAEIKEKNNKTNMGNQLPIFITLVATSVIIFYWVQG